MNILDDESSVTFDSRKKKKLLGIYFACCNVYGNSMITQESSMREVPQMPSGLDNEDR